VKWNPSGWGLPAARPQFLSEVCTDFVWCPAFFWTPVSAGVLGVVVEKVALVAGWLFGNRAVGPSTQVTGKATNQELARYELDRQKSIDLTWPKNLGHFGCQGFYG
jgi:hypothetical protein